MDTGLCSPSEHIVTPWLNQHLTAWVYLTAAIVATGLLLVLWVTPQNTAQHAAGHIKKNVWTGGSLRSCAAVVLSLWVGLALRNEWDQGEPVTLLTACVVLAISWLMLTFGPLIWRAWQRKRAVKLAHRCIGKQGRMYRAIGPDEAGVVEFPQGGKMYRLPAAGESNEALPAFCDVRVTGVNEAGVLLVVGLIERDEITDQS